MYLIVIVALVLCFLFKLLNVNNYPERSLFFSANGKMLEQILKHTPTLCQPFEPTRLWGYSGHIQTIIQGAISRISCPLVNGRRLFFRQADGATVTYDLYQPVERHPLGDYTLAICPGICNSSESVYIRRVVYHGQFQGYRVAVLNHVGALPSVQVTSPRIFCYGNTGDYGGMMSELSRRFPATKFVCVGFSMGANIVTKYLGESHGGAAKGRSERPDNIVAGVSACQGYDAIKAMNHLLEWDGFRRLYCYAMTENMKGILRCWQKQLFPDSFKREKDICERDVWAAASLVDLDNVYTRKVEGYELVDDLYKCSSSVHYLDGIRVPMVFINARDDPIVPPPLLDIIKKAAESRDNFLYVEQKFGGHLGFYEGGFIWPRALTWLDKAVVELANALTQYTAALGKTAASSLDSAASSDEAGSATDAAFESFESSASSDEDSDPARGAAAAHRLSLPQPPPPQQTLARRSRPRFVCKRNWSARNRAFL